MKFENKRAIVTILRTDLTNDYDNKKAYRLIQAHKLNYNKAKIINDEHEMQQCLRQIQANRKIMRTLQYKIYTMNIYIKKYKYKSGKMLQTYELRSHNQQNFKVFINEAINVAIRSARQDLKPINIPVKIGQVLAYKHGGIFTEEGTILKAYVKKNINNLYDGKVPTTQKRYIGIELEFCAPIKEEQLALKIFKSGLHKFVQLKEDGSLRPRAKEFAFELAILLEETTYKKGLKNIINLLTEIKAVAKDRRCGLHIHFDMRHRDKDLVYNNLVACQYALLSIVDPERYNNEFCTVVKNRKFPTEFKGDRSERYKTINAAAYYKYRTIEIRMHEGSVDYKEISNWIDLLMKITNYSKKFKDNVTELVVLKKRLKLKEKLFNYSIDRSCTWQIQNSDSTRRLRNDIEALRNNRPALPLMPFQEEQDSSGDNIRNERWSVAATAPTQQTTGPSQPSVVWSDRPIVNRLNALLDELGVDNPVPIEENNN